MPARTRTEDIQIHNLSLGFSSPMIFMGMQFWTDDVPVWPLIQHLVATGRYKNMLLTLSDDPAEIDMLPRECLWVVERIRPQVLIQGADGLHVVVGEREGHNGQVFGEVVGLGAGDGN